MEVNNEWIERAQALWHDTFELIPADEWRPDEVELMRQLCQAITDLDAIEHALKGAELLLPGSHGGTIANPLLAEKRLLVGLIVNLQKALKLPSIDDLADEDDDRGVILPFREESGKPMSRSASARKAASARWDKRGQGGNRAGLA